MLTLSTVAPIIWAKWGGVFLGTLRQESSDAADGLAFRALNSDAGVRRILVVCITDDAQVQTIKDSLGLKPVVRTLDWATYSVAEMVFKTEKGTGLGHQELHDPNDGTALILCATRPAEVRRLEALCDLPE